MCKILAVLQCHESNNNDSDDKKTKIIHKDDDNYWDINANYMEFYVASKERERGDGREGNLP